ncbi:hypothetical protein GCM10009102_29550 [Sphingomonas insulae]|uniref:Transposase n=1 Tax=Sphingomonas insulae TaxID=424800 RepID=A0ABN1HZB2_9SPHN
MGHRVPTGAELRELLAVVITRAAGGKAVRWHERIGPVLELPLSHDSRCNWRVEPVCDGMEAAIIAKTVELVRVKHPYIAG